jgi:acetyl-CoA carboxylase biotin carboxylase subunit
VLNGFVPAPGHIDTMRVPDGPGIRNDSGVYAGSEVSVFYDPMISKLAAWGRTRLESIERMRRALGEFTISGELSTNLDFHRWLVRHPRFVAGEFDTNFINQEFLPALLAPKRDPERIAAVLIAAAQSPPVNGAKPQFQTGRAAPVSPWKTYGRIESLRR